MSLTHALMILSAFGIATLLSRLSDPKRAERRAQRVVRTEHRARMAEVDMRWRAQVRRAERETSVAEIEARSLRRTENEARLAENATRQLEALTAEIEAGRLPAIPGVAKPKRLKYRMRGYGGGPNHTSLHPRFWNQVKTMTFVPGIGHCRTSDVKGYMRAVERHRGVLKRLESSAWSTSAP